MQNARQHGLSTIFWKSINAATTREINHQASLVTNILVRTLARPDLNGRTELEMSPSLGHLGDFIVLLISRRIFYAGGKLVRMAVAVDFDTIEDHETALPVFFDQYRLANPGVLRT